MEADAENPDYLRRQLVTYLGNKRKLLGPIGAAIDEVKRRLNKPKLRILDAFSGSGVVSRFCKRHADYLAANDLEPFAQALARCFLTNADVVPPTLTEVAACLNRSVSSEPLEPGFIAELYAPRSDDGIRPGERVFYTRANARRLDDYRRRMSGLPQPTFDLLLGPLLSEASVHANTSGVFKGFHRDRRTKVGKFGGTNADALSRILGEIVLDPPVLSRYSCDVEVFGDDANAVVRRLRGLDLAYFDPPYNQHPYGSNYFMLNLLVEYRRPERISARSGIPVDWRRSAYNSRGQALAAFADLAERTDAKFLLTSFNNEGFIPGDEMAALLGKLGRVTTVETPYNTFRGSRNLAGRSLHVVERLFLVERA
jgi:adenine-specific DNA-methyltransferase